MAIISEVSEDLKFKVTLNNTSGAIEVKNLIDNTWMRGDIPEENIPTVAALVVPGFANGDILYAIGYYIASKISGGSSAN